MSAIRREGDDLVLQLYLQPRGGKDEVIGMHGDALKLRIAAPPVDGAANERLVRFLADAFAVPQRQVVLEQGHSGRRKRVRIVAPTSTPEWLDLATKPM